MATQPIYQFYSELADYRPKIWRRFQVPRNITMAKLAYILMTMYEMQASHLFCIEIPVYAGLRLRYELPSEDDFPPEDGVRVQDASESMLGQQFSGVDTKLTMQYDYGDGWEISLTLEEVFVDDELPGRALPRVLEGSGYGIIEDCGGPGGLEGLAKAFQKKTGRDYQAYREWLGRDDLDLSAFDIDDMNFRLKKVPRIYRDLYEYKYAPTPRSMDILERRYLKKKPGGTDAEVRNT